MKGFAALLAVTMLTVAGVCGWVLLVGARTATAAGSEVLTLRVGDVVRVEGGVIGCVVRRRSGERLIDCRRAGPLAGSYGTMLGERKALAVRFRDNRTAKVVFSANHGEKAIVCCSGG